METAVQTDQKLAAIMFTDIISYTKMMSKNEKKALSLLQEHNILLNEEFAKHDGNVIKETGDGFLTAFSSSLKSVKAAIAIQNSLYLYNSTQDTDDQINIRIGIHLAEIVNKEKNGSVDVLGDGVNIAKRIEGFSEPNGGSLCFSQQIYDQVHDKIKSYIIESIGQKRLKNIIKPFELYRLILPSQKSNVRAVGERKVKNSIAVLAFDNMSSDKEMKHFADGIAEELLNVMAKEKELKVISRTSSFAYRDKNLPSKQIGRELNVEHILEGSVRTAGDKIRVTAQLIQVADSFHLWSETYTRTLDDYFKIQDELCSKILTELLDRLVSVDSSCDSCKTDNLKAYNLYAEGRHHWNKREESELEKGIECFKKALNEDPSFSLAYSGLIDSWILLIELAHTKKEKLLPQCWDALHKAEKLGDTSAEFYTSHAAILEREGKTDEAIEYYITAIEQNPNYATAHHWLGMQYHSKNENEKAVEELDKAMTLDPKSAIIHYAGAMVYSIMHVLDKSLTLYKQISEMSPGYLGVECQIGVILQKQYKWEEAQDYYSDLLKSDYYKNNTNQVGLFRELFNLYLKMNQIDKAIKINKLLEKMDDKLLEPLGIKLKYMGLAYNYFLLKQPKESIKYHTHMMEMHPNEEWYAFSNLDLANCLIYMKDFDKASEILKETGETKGNVKDRHHKIHVEFEIKFNQALSMIMNNDIENAYVTIHKMKEMDKNILHCYYHNLFSLYFYLNDIDSGYEWYYKEFEERKKPSFNIIYNPWCENARKDKRYIKLLKEMKLYDYWKNSL